MGDDHAESLSDRARRIAERVKGIPNDIVSSFVSEDPQERAAIIRAVTSEVQIDSAPIINWLELRHANAAELLKHRLFLLSGVAKACVTAEIPEFAGGVCRQAKGVALSEGILLTHSLDRFVSLFAQSLCFIADEIEKSESRQNADDGLTLRVRLDEIVESLQQVQSHLAVPKTESQDYVTATDIRTNHSPPGVVLDQRRLVKFLQLHPAIRTDRPLGKNGKPRKNRLLVHLADWHKHRDALIEWDKATLRNVIDTISEEEIAVRTAAVPRKKNRRR